MDKTDSKPKMMTPAEEELLIQSEFDDVLGGYLSSNHRKKVEIIERAFKFAKEAHKGVRRRSGEPYILHPIAVAKIASQEIGLGSTSICAALLHDVVEDTDYTVEDIEQHFGKKIAQLVAGLTKISGGIFGDKASAQAENFRKLLLTMSEDIRVVLIKMADRLHNMRTLGSMAPNKQYKIAGETLYIYAPLAHRLGLFAIKTELEDLSFKYEHPGAYERISLKIKESEERRTAVYNDFSAPIKERLVSMGLKFEAHSRLKSVYSIWKKMEAKKIPFEEVYDLYAMRIIFEDEGMTREQEKQTCWNIYSAITDLYRLHPDRTRDWIACPKANGYQALHLTVMGPDGNWIEVQIRSRRMDEIAEKGFAAHWKYKIGEGDEESELTVWLRTIKDILDDPNTQRHRLSRHTQAQSLLIRDCGVYSPGRTCHAAQQRHRARRGLQPPFTAGREMYRRQGQPQARAIEPPAQQRRPGGGAHFPVTTAQGRVDGVSRHGQGAHPSAPGPAQGAAAHYRPRQADICTFPRG